MIESNNEWEVSAKNDALYAIASVKGKRGGKWSPEDFFAKGEVYLSYIETLLEDVPKESKILDVGCGAGRITRALAKRFGHVTGVDVSQTMIKLAKELCADVENAEFKLGDGIGFPVSDNSIDLIVSFQVLQHVHSPALPIIFQSCYKTLKNSGLVILHVPAPSFIATFHSSVRLVPLRRLLTLGVRRVMPKAMLASRFWVNTQYHSYENSYIFDLLKASGFSEIQAHKWREEDPLTTFYVAKKMQ